MHIRRMVQMGMPNREIARNLGLSEGTVRKHLKNAYARLGVLNRVETVATAFGPSGLAADTIGPHALAGSGT